MDILICRDIDFDKLYVMLLEHHISNAFCTYVGLSAELWSKYALSNVARITPGFARYEHEVVFNEHTREFLLLRDQHSWNIGHLYGIKWKAFPEEMRGLLFVYEYTKKFAFHIDEELLPTELIPEATRLGVLLHPQIVPRKYLRLYHEG